MYQQQSMILMEDLVLIHVHTKNRTARPCASRDEYRQHNNGMSLTCAVRALDIATTQCA